MPANPARGRDNRPTVSSASTFPSTEKGPKYGPFSNYICVQFTFPFNAFILVCVVGICFKVSFISYSCLRAPTPWHLSCDNNRPTVAPHPTRDRRSISSSLSLHIRVQENHDFGAYVSVYCIIWKTRICTGDQGGLLRPEPAEPRTLYMYILLPTY